MNNETLTTLREAFCNELNTYGDSWRILRIGTLVDLIRLSFAKYLSERSTDSLVEIFNSCMKILLLSRIQSMQLDINQIENTDRVGDDINYILENYDEIVANVKPKLEEAINTDQYELNSNMQYLKVINQLEIDSYSDDVFIEIMGIVYCIIAKNKANNQ